MSDVGDRALDALRRLHEAVDVMTAPLSEQHADRLQCRRGCASCCIDGLSVFEVEAERIRREHAALLAHGRPHEAGGCAFLDDAGGCRVYESRPYICRTQGLPLRWIEEADDGSGLIERRDICPLNEPDGALPVEQLRAEACWTLGPIEQQLAGLQQLHGDGALTRVALRGLFSQEP